MEFMKKSDARKKYKYTDDELIWFLKKFHKDNGKAPGLHDFIGNRKYPSHSTYDNRFGSWSNALKLANLDVDTLVKNGILDNCYQKGRLAELIVSKSFKNESIDLSGENCNSPFDGICPKNKTYDVKSAKLTHSKKNYEWKGWFFHFRNLQIDKIDYFILLAFDEQYKKLIHVWMIPCEQVIDKDTLYVSFNNINKMKNYIINIEKCNFDVLNKKGGE